MKYFILIVTVFVFAGCSTNEESKPAKKEVEQPEIKTTDKADLVEIKGHNYTEYYDVERKKIKFQGTQDDDKKRHGKWTMYSESGAELSVSFYKNGVLHGHSYVKHENGAMYYYGEYENGKRVGVWKVYDESGKLISETDHGPAK